MVHGQGPWLGKLKTGFDHCTHLLPMKTTRSFACPLPSAELKGGMWQAGFPHGSMASHIQPSGIRSSNSRLRAWGWCLDMCAHVCVGVRVCRIPGCGWQSAASLTVPRYATMAGRCSLLFERRQAQRKLLREEYGKYLKRLQK